MSAANLNALVDGALSRQDAQRFVAMRNAAVQCCAPGWLGEAFGPQVLIMPARLENGASDAQIEEHRIAGHSARAANMYDNTARLRGAFWCEVALRAALSRNRGDEEAQRALRMLRGLLHDAWPAPGITVSQRELHGVTREVWAAWLFEAETPPTLQQRYAVALLHVAQALSEPTSIRSRGRQADMFDPPRRAHG